jgi:proline iminopeptidase
MIEAYRAPWPAIEPYAHGYLDTGEGHEIYWEECGNPNGIPVVFLHGGPGGRLLTSPAQAVRSHPLPDRAV